MEISCCNSIDIFPLCPLSVVRHLTHAAVSPVRILSWEVTLCPRYLEHACSYEEFALRQITLSASVPADNGIIGVIIFTRYPSSTVSAAEHPDFCARHGSCLRQTRLARTDKFRSILSVVDFSTYHFRFVLFDQRLSPSYNSSPPLAHNMPKENKKRGRRGGEKRKQDDLDENPAIVEYQNSKRRKSTEEDSVAHTAEAGADYIPLQLEGEAERDRQEDAYPPGLERPFFGMLDEEEQEYFRHADVTLEENAFADPEEKKLFLADVYKQAEGKELKIAQSQGCSRLLERLIQVWDSEQLKGLYEKFAENFIHLISHRFASHCCEALFLRAGALVTEEMKAKEEPSVTFENLFLSALKELESNLGFLMTDRYASHVLRVLLLVLAGEPVDQSSTQHLLKSKRKENVGSEVAETKEKPQEEPRLMPESFGAALEKLISGSVAGLDTDKLRALATHPNGSPTLQLLLKLELTHFGKQRGKDEASIIRTLLPDDPITSDCGSAQFISGIVYDATGSHLVEKIIEHAPGKTFKNLYKEFFKERIASLSRNEIAQYVVCRILERMSKDDLYDAHEVLVPTVSNLLERDRTIVVRTLIERCAVRKVDTQGLALAIEETWNTPEGFDVRELLKVDTSTTADNNTPQDSVQSSFGATSAVTTPKALQARRAHFNVLAQAMLLVPGPLSSIVLESLTRLETPTLLHIASDFITSRTLQQALTTTNAAIIERRKLIQLFYGNIGSMALDKAASHVVDCIWQGTHGLAFIRERIAEELAENEAELRQSPSGRAVWKNWKMDLYKRRRLDWIKQSKHKASDDGFQSFSELEANKPEAERKTPLEMARLRHANKKAGESKDKTRPHSRATGSNLAGPPADAAGPRTATASG
nr:nucleolar protein 9 [Quercus suber]